MEFIKTIIPPFHNKSVYQLIDFSIPVHGGVYIPKNASFKNVNVILKSICPKSILLYWDWCFQVLELLVSGPRKAF